MIRSSCVAICSSAGSTPEKLYHREHGRAGAVIEGMNHRILLVSLLAAGCSHPHTVKAPEPVAPPPTTAAKQPEPVKETAASPNLAVSDSLAQKCKLTFDSVPAAPKFQYDDVQLVQQD